MADNLDSPSFGNFSIQDTMEMGMGNSELLNDLMSPETSTESPDGIQPIIKEVIPTTAPAAATPKGKDVVPNPDGIALEGQDLLANFLGDHTDEDDDVPEKSSIILKEEVDKGGEGTQFSALATDLYNLGVFTKEEGEEPEPVSTAEEFLERFTAEKKKGAIEVVNNFIGQFGEDYQQAFDAIFVKGVNPKEYFETYNKAVGFTEMDLSLEGNQEAIMKQALTEQGFDPEDVITEIERLKNYGDLESVAAKNHKVLVKKEAVKLQNLEEEAERQLVQKTAIRNTYINNVQNILQEKLKTKEFDGIPINPKLVNELQDFLLVDKWKTASGENLTDFDRAILEMKRPENHAAKVKLGLLLKIMEKDPTLSTIQKSGVSKKADQLFGEVARQVSKAKTSVPTSSESGRWFK